MRFIVVFVIVFIMGCSSSRVKKECCHQSQQKQIKKDKEHRINVLNKKIQENPKDVQAYYEQACFYSEKKDLKMAIDIFHKVLKLQPDFTPAYTSLTTIHLLKLVDVEKRIRVEKEKKLVAKAKGKDDIITTYEKLNALHEEKAKIYLSQAKTYLLYKSLLTSIAQFPELEAHLRDMQDQLSEIQEEQRKRTKSPLVQDIYVMRGKLAHKHAEDLLLLGREAVKDGHYLRAIDYLRDADAQMGKFFQEEDPTAEISLLKSNENTRELAERVSEDLSLYYNKMIKIYLKNRENFEKMGYIQETIEASKSIELYLENLIQLQIRNLWRFNKIKKVVAEKSEQMIPAYKKFIQHAPKSPKVGNYYFKLAKCYAHKGDKEKAVEYARKAEKDLGSYKIQEFIKELKK